MALFKRNDNKDQAAEDTPGEDSAPEQAPASRKRFGKPKP